MNPKRKYKYLVYTYDVIEGRDENIIFQGIFDTEKGAYAYRRTLNKNGYNRVSIDSVPYFEEE